MAVISGIGYSLLTSGADGVQVIVFDQDISAEDISDNLPKSLDRVSNIVLTSGAQKTFCKEADGVWREW